MSKAKLTKPSQKAKRSRTPDQISARIGADIIELLDQEAALVGCTRSKMLETILRACLSPGEPDDEPTKERAMLLMMRAPRRPGD